MEIKNLRAIHDRELIYELIEEGEHEEQDFKFSISDSRKIARSIAAFANNRGGRLLEAVKAEYRKQADEGMRKKNVIG